MDRIIALDGNTWQIIEGGEGATVYCCLLAGTQRAILIDTGLGNVDLSKITRSLTELPIDVVCTHGHLDHIGGNDQFENVYLSPDDLDVYNLHCQLDYRQAMLGGLLPNLDPSSSPAPPGNAGLIPLHDGMIFDLGDRHVEVIATPGHSKGSVCLLDIEKRQLFSGDTLSAVGVLLAIDHACSVRVLSESMLKLKRLSERFDLVWSGHHNVPVNKDVIPNYLDCCADILTGKGEPIIEDIPMGKICIMENGPISIAYFPDRIQ
jgi:hydroxyacylglutathione hydrolase